MSEVLGIDFGTTHTHVCLGTTDSNMAESVKLEGNSNVTASALLYVNGKAKLWGNTAIEEYSNHLDGNDADIYELCTNFKPDIENDEATMKKARLFLEMATEKAVPQKKGKKILVGVPAGASEKFKDRLKNLMKDSFGDVETVSEPLGALVHFHERKALNDNDIINDVLVIDFGGGTCDFAYTYGGKTVNVELEEGFYYGGRLFDDLFFQWWEESNREEIEECPEEYKNVIFLKKCRDVKELFSTRMGQDRDGKFNNRDFLGYGSLRGTWNDFEKRAKAYSPSERFLKMNFLPENVRKELFSSPVNLLQRFRSLLQGVKEHYYRNHAFEPRFKWVVLAGGSSLWPFVRDDVKAVLSIDDAHILQEPDPYSTIALGLAQIPYQQKLLSARKKKLESGFLRKNHEIVESAFEKLKNDIIEDISLDSKNSIWGYFFKSPYKAYIAGDIDKEEWQKQLAQQALVAPVRLENHWKRRLEEMGNGLKNQLETAIREDAGKNSLTLPLRVDDFLKFPFGHLFDSFHSKVKKDESYLFGIAWFQTVAILTKTFRLTGKIYDRFFLTQKAKEKKIAKQLEKSRKEFEDNYKKKIEEFFQEKASVKTDVQRQLEYFIKHAIDDIEILQSQVF